MIKAVCFAALLIVSSIFLAGCGGDSGADNGGITDPAGILDSGGDGDGTGNNSDRDDDGDGHADDSPLDPDKSHLFILSGQSNMANMDPDAPNSFTPTIENLMEDDQVTIVKYAEGGRPIERWDEGNSMWNGMSAEIDKALETGKHYDTVTFVWMQGEKDSQENTATDIYEAKLLDQLHDMGFKRIMLNPWTERPSDPTRPWPFVDSDFIGTGRSKVEAPLAKIAKLHAVQPDAVAIVNYENAGMHLKLSGEETAAPGSSIDIDTIYNIAEVAKRQEQKDRLGDADTEITYFKWCPPWSHNYDPLAFGTLGWIAERMIELNPKTPRE